MEHSIPVPIFLKHLRQAAFARVYSADKNVSIFFGRPPRIHKKYCRVELLRYHAEDTLEDPDFAWWEHPFRPAADHFDYTADTQWSASCALLKEEILDLYREKDDNERTRKAGLVQ